MLDKRIFDCYIDSNEIVELLKILNRYLNEYIDAIPEIFTTSILTKTIQTRCEILSDNIDEICADML